MRERVRQVWAQLESGMAAGSGFAKVRLTAEAPAGLYLGLQYPEAIRMLMLRLPLPVLRDSSPGFIQLRGLRTRPFADPDDHRYGFAAVLLVEPRLGDLFDVLVMDLAEALNEASMHTRQARVFLQRLEHWRTLFDRYRGEELSLEARTGLFGELRWIHTLLDAGIPGDVATGTWQGSPGGDQDFVCGPAAVEIKTSADVGILRIGSERQLDEAPFEQLALVHQRVSMLVEGHSLPAEIDALRDLLADQEMARDQFEARLAQTGYSDAHRGSYDDVRYVHEATTAYRVSGDFPRITPAAIRPGVRDVRYNIDLRDCQPFLVPLEAVIEAFR